MIFYYSKQKIKKKYKKYLVNKHFKIAYIIIKITFIFFLFSINTKIRDKINNNIYKKSIIKDGNEIDKNNYKIEGQINTQKNNNKIDNKINKIKNKEASYTTEIDNIPPEKYEKNILEEIRDILNKGHSLIEIEQLFFINGLIRKYKPKKILEIGVCTGGISATILNAIKDIDGAMLYSCDLETKDYINNNLEIGHIVKDYLPNLTNKWKLFTGNTTSAFIEEIGGDIDFVIIDTAHVMPGEVLTLIEILPFLKKNAIISLDDIHFQQREKNYNQQYFYPCNNLLISVLRGKKIIYQINKNKPFQITKLGAVILDDNQEIYFFEYFYLLTNVWSYMPKKFEIDCARIIIKKYYSPFLLSIYDKAVELNYKRLKIIGLINKDYIQYTFPEKKRFNFDNLSFYKK